MAKKKKTTAKRTRKKVETIKFPVDWQSQFKSSTMRTRFNLNLSQPMIEFLSAVSDDVMWDRSSEMGNIHRPDNWIGTGGCLEKRGLLIHKRHVIDDFNRMDVPDDRMNEVGCWVLTPAGEALVELLKVTGIFIEADAAIIKKSRRG